MLSTALPSPYFRDEHDMLRDQLRRFIEQEVKPHAEAWEETGNVPRDVLRRMGELGFLGIRYPEQYGGSAMDSLGSVVLAEELARSTFGGFAITVLVHTDMASPHLMNAGTTAQKARYMPDIVAGNKICAVAVTEPGAGSDVKGIRTTARRDGADYVLNGSKMFITNGVLADVYFVATKTNPAARGSGGISIFIVEKDTPGFSVGRALKKTGWLSSDTAELVLQDVRVPAGNLLGEENRGFYAVMKNFQNERLVLGAQAIAEAETALEMTLRYVIDRKAFGATLWDKQAIRQRLAMLAARCEAARNLVHNTAWLDAQG
ncbi:MAG TPA: acyl-CoA dehydrogenase family protein, partial [Vineibacter sp.]|nr:acyl-CoA dehydrogenase family protein [Vineibacter sp.]